MPNGKEPEGWRSPRRFADQENHRVTRSVLARPSTALRVQRCHVNRSAPNSKRDRALFDWTERRAPARQTLNWKSASSWEVQNAATKEKSRLAPAPLAKWKFEPIRAAAAAGQ